MNTPAEDKVVLYDHATPEHDTTPDTHGHPSPVCYVPLEEPYDIGHGFPCQYAATSGAYLYLIHSHEHD